MDSRNPDSGMIDARLRETELRAIASWERNYDA